MGVLYGFTAKEIQKYILDGDKLREMVGASNIINSLCTDLMDKTLTELGINSGVEVISQVAGGIRLEIDKYEDAEKLASLFPLLVDRAAPGLRNVQAIESVPGTVGEALMLLNKRLEETRSNLVAALPEIGPLIERNQRTGSAAVCRAADNSWHDRKTRLLEKATSGGKTGPNTLLQRFAGMDTTPAHWPVDMDDIVTEENKYLAVVHADGNDLGKKVITLIKKITDDPNAKNVLKKFSDAIESATFRAVQEACNEFILSSKTKNGKHPARPIVLGGDDMTAIIRADLALPFTQRYLELFEQYSGERLMEDLPNYNLGTVTACAGVALVKCKYPFWRAYELSSSMADYAKEISKSKDNLTSEGLAPSSVMFHRVTTSVTGDFADVRNHELTAHNGNISFCCGPYAVGRYIGSMRSYTSLVDLANVLADLPSGPVRRLITTMYSDLTNAKQDFDRIVEIAGRQKKQLGVPLKKNLAALTGNDDMPLWTTEEHAVTPLLDALRLIEVGTVKRTTDEEAAE